MKSFMRRPLTMSRFSNGFLYTMLVWTINSLVNSYWVTENNPQGLTGTPGWAVLLGSLVFCNWLAYQENIWIDQIERKNRVDS